MKGVVIIIILMFACSVGDETGDTDKGSGGGCSCGSRGTGPDAGVG